VEGKQIVRHFHAILYAVRNGGRGVACIQIIIILVYIKIGKRVVVFSVRVQTKIIAIGLTLTMTLIAKIKAFPELDIKVVFFVLSVFIIGAVGIAVETELFAV